MMNNKSPKPLEENEFSNYEPANSAPFSWYANQVGKKSSPKKKSNKWVNPKKKKKTKMEYFTEPGLYKEFRYYLKQVGKKETLQKAAKERIALLGMRIKPSR